MKIVYVGLKEMKSDNVAGTGLTWTRGQIHEVEDDAKAKKLLAHPLIWQDADSKYELVPEPSLVPAEPRVKFMPEGDAFFDPVVITVDANVFSALQKKELIAVFMKPEDADVYAQWKAARDDTSPKNTGPAADLQKLDKRSKEYRDWVAKQGLEGKKVA